MPKNSKSVNLIEKQNSERMRRLCKEEREYENELGEWLDEQMRNYKNKTSDMADPEKYKKFTEFINKHKHVFTDKDFQLMGIKIDDDGLD